MKVLDMAIQTGLDVQQCVWLKHFFPRFYEQTVGLYLYFNDELTNMGFRLLMN